MFAVVFLTRSWLFSVSTLLVTNTKLTNLAHCSLGDAFNLAAATNSARFCRRFAFFGRRWASRKRLSVCYHAGSERRGVGVKRASVKRGGARPVSQDKTLTGACRRRREPKGGHKNRCRTSCRQPVSTFQGRAIFGMW